MQPTTVITRVCPGSQLSRSNMELPASTVRVSSSKTSISFQAGNSASTPGKRLTEQGPARVFNFDQCLTAEATNVDVFNVLSTQLVQSCFTGVNVTLWAYGAAATGKTHTMFGSSVDEGLIARSLKRIMSRVSPNDDVQVIISHYEIYNESVRDLLAPAPDKRRLRVLEDKGNSFVEGLTERVVANEHEALSCLTQGASRRTAVLASDGSYRTSCSHSIFQVELITTKISSVEGSCSKMSSKLRFVDLAGAENLQRSQARVKEASTINASLMTLRLVVNALTPVASSGRGGATPNKAAAPYMNSLLTWLLKDSFGGNSKTVVIATIAQDVLNAEETLSTLRMAEKFRALSNPVIMNELPSSVVTRAVTKEIQSLHQDIESSKTPRSDRRGARFSVEALQRLNQPTQADYEEEIRVYKERALRAEKESRERAEVLWEAFESLRNQLSEMLQEARQEALETARRDLYEEIRKEVLQGAGASRPENQIALEQQVECLAEHASALTIQLAWRKYQMRKQQRQRTMVTDSKRVDQLEMEKQSLLEELDSLKITAIQQVRASESLHLQLQAVQRESEKTVAQMRKTLDAAIKDKDQEIARLRDQLSKTTTTAKAETVSASAQQASSELKRTQTELSESRAALRAEGEKASKLRAEVEHLRDDVLSKERQLKQLQDLVQSRREQAEREAEELRERVQQLEAMIETSHASNQKELEDRQRQVNDLESLIESLRQAEAESRRLRETETDALREQLKTVEANAVEEIQRLTNQLQERGNEEAKRADQELTILRTKIGTLELMLETNKAVTEKEVQERDRRLREIERLNVELEHREREEIERKNRELETMEIFVKRLQKELETTKKSTSREVQERDRKLKELESALKEQLTQAQQRAVGASFMQYRRDPRKQYDSNRRLSTISMIPPAPSMLANQSLAPAHQPQEDLLCVRVDIESFDERSNLFYPCSSSVTPADPTTHIFNVKSPMYDLKKARWTRIKIRVLHGSVHRVDEITGICLEHHLPASRSIMHRLRVVKTERGLSSEQGVQTVICDWDSSASATAAFVDDSPHAHDKAHPCFCFQKMEESGPMTLHATFVVDGAPVHWEYPLRFRNKSAVIEKIPGIGPKILLSRRASDEIKHEYLNASWFSMENESGNVRAGPVRNGQRIISFSGYLQKYQSHRSGKVQRWFVFAPPFLLCYQDAAKAAEDFSKARALPHSANRAMRVQSTTKVTTVDPEMPGMEKVEFIVAGEDKTWHLQAANKEDLDRWVGALNAWVAREKEIAPYGYDRPMNNGAAAIGDEEMDAGMSLLQDSH